MLLWYCLLLSLRCAIIKLCFKMACSLGRDQMNLTLLSLRCAIIKLCFKMACSLGRDQMNLTLLSLRCAIIKLCFKMACSLGRDQMNLTLLSLRCAIDLSPYRRRPNGCQPIYELSPYRERPNRTMYALFTFDTSLITHVVYIQVMGAAPP